MTKKISTAALRVFAVGAIAGCILDIGVFAYQLDQHRTINQISAKAHCYDTVFDHAVNRVENHAQLTKDAKVCSKLP